VDREDFSQDRFSQETATLSTTDKRASFYLNDIPLREARERFRQALAAAGLDRPLGSETLLLDRALGRVTAEAVWAKRSSPHYHAAAMDGFALRAADTDGANDRNPTDLALETQTAYVDTGDAMPSWADAVVPIELVEPIPASADVRHCDSIRIRASVSPWSNVRLMGEDMVTTELVLPAGHVLQPIDLGAIAACGHDCVRVWRRPRVAILPTGSELVPPGTQAKAGQIIEFNSLVLAGQVEAWGGEPSRLPIVGDDPAKLKKAVASASAAHDLVLVIAGSSAGSEDFTAGAIGELGRVLVHGIAVRPGHPVILGMLDSAPSEKEESSSRSVPVIGVPGYPVSAALTGEIFVEPLLAEWTGRLPRELPTLEATITRKVHSSLGDDEYLRVTVGRVGNRIVAAPLTRGAGVITSLVRADGIVIIPAGVQGFQAGEKVNVKLYRTPAEIERTILILGSHDLCIDLMAQFIAFKGARISSANLGSLGGLIALRRREAHLSGSHLLDPESGEYNLTYVAKYLPEVETVVLGFVYRQQGLIVERDNPLGIQGLEDLTREDVVFINRQRGSGTRILLDYHLASQGINAKTIRGYDQEAFTHLAVAAAVTSGRANCGLGIQAAAAALDLDFIPLFQERYDLIIPMEHYQHPKLQPLLELLEDPEFVQAVKDLPGYDTAPMGKRFA
jgi:putative molybdopterin biosynthesis protein